MKQVVKAPMYGRLSKSKKEIQLGDIEGEAD